MTRGLIRYPERHWPGGGSGLYVSAAAARHGRRRSAGVLGLWLVGLGGLAMAAAGYLTAPAPPPRASASALPATGAAGAPALPASMPTRVDIDAIGVHAPVQAGGVDAAGGVEVPPLTQPHLTTWYRLGVAPGQAGNAVIVGHVDTRKVGPAVFYDLGRLAAGQTVSVTREDGIVAVFRVDGVALFPKDKFPVEVVYGPTRTPGLRLVTCGGDFDSKTRNYDGNTVVAATLVSWHDQSPDEAAAPMRTYIPELPPPPKPSKSAVTRR